MSHIKQKTHFIFVLLILISCPACEYNKEKEHGGINGASDKSIHETTSLINESENYLENRDFDGDNKSDYIYFSYSGGAHCCYRMNLKLSSKKDTIHYPFEMDGGYSFGIVDGSQTNQFEIKDFDKDGLPEIFMCISSYNGETFKIDPKWTEEFGIKTNRILFDFHDRAVRLSDYME